MLWLRSLAWAEENLVRAASDRAMVVGKRDLVLGLDGVATLGDAPVQALSVPVRIGLGDNAELFMAPRLQTAFPNISDPALGATVRFVDTEHLEAGARVAGDLAFFQDPKAIAVDVGVPLRLHGPRVAVDTGVFYRPTVVPGLTHGVRVPFALTFNVSDPLALHLSTGFGMADLGGANTPLKETRVGVSYTGGDPRWQVHAQVGQPEWATGAPSRPWSASGTSWSTAALEATRPR